MPGQNDFQVFAGASGANVITQPTYISLAARSSGFQSGIAQSAQLNKVWRQSSIIASMIAQFIVDNASGTNSIDDGTIATLEANFKLAIQGVTRTKITVGNFNLYVDIVNGNDANPGTAPASQAKKTINGAIAAAYSLYDFGGNALTINIASGTYNEAVGFAGLPFGANSITMIGNNSSPSSVQIIVTNQNAIQVVNNGVLHIQGLTVQASGTGSVGYGLVVESSTVSGQNMIFGSCGNVQLAAGILAEFTATGPLTFQGTSTWGVAAESGSSMFLNSIAVTFAGGCTYSQAWALVTQSGSLNVVGTTFSGSFTGVRYIANFCSSVSVNGAGINYFPGSAPGSVAQNAVYA